MQSQIHPANVPYLPPIPLPVPSTQLPGNYHAANPRIEQKLADYLAASTQQSSISAEIYAIAEREGIKVTVLTNEEYDRQYPGTGGVTVGPADAREVIMPERSLDDPANTTLEHELMHAYVENDSSPGKPLYDAAVDTSRSTAERQAAAEQLFESVGGTKAQGRAWLEGLEGIPQSVLDGTGDHMLNSATDRLIYRQKAGESLDTPETLTVMRNAAKGEAAMHLRSQLTPDEEPSFFGKLTLAAGVSGSLRSMYGDGVPEYQGGSIDDYIERLVTFLDGKIEAFNQTRDAYATNR